MDKTTVKKTIAILSLCCFLGAQAWVSPVMQLIRDYFPSVDYSLVTQVATLPSLLSMIFVLLAGAVVGKKVRFIPLMSTGLVLIFLSGLIPLLYRDSFAVLLICRVLTGMGIGMIGIRNSLIIKSFEEPYRTKVLGWVMLANSGMGVVAAKAAGFLGDIKWNYAFSVLVLAVVPLVLINLWVDEPELERTSEDTAVAEESSGKKRFLSPRVIAYTVTIFIVMMIINPINVGISSIIANKNIGGASVSGTVVAFGMVSGALIGLFYNSIQKSIKRFIWTVMFLSIALGAILIITANSVLLMIIGNMLINVSISMTTVTMARYIGLTAYPETFALSVSLSTAFGQLGNYAATYWMGACSRLFGNIDIYTACLYMAIIVSSIPGLISIFKDLRPKEAK